MMITEKEEKKKSKIAYLQDLIINIYPNRSFKFNKGSVPGTSQKILPTSKDRTAAMISLLIHTSKDPGCLYEIYLKIDLRLQIKKKNYSQMNYLFVIAEI
jgi:hypothetical protein